jgi:hypothetical protein
VYFSVSDKFHEYFPLVSLRSFRYEHNLNHNMTFFYIELYRCFSQLIYIKRIFNLKNKLIHIKWINLVLEWEES